MFSKPSEICFFLSQEENLRYGEEMFYKMEVRGKTANVAEINEENVGGANKTPLPVVIKSVVQPEDIFGLIHRWER